VQPIDQQRPDRADGLKLKRHRRARQKQHEQNEPAIGSHGVMLSVVERSGRQLVPYVAIR
jgi:hypothetical protein